MMEFGQDCQRCGDHPAVIISYFNRDYICSRCKTEETQAPGYEHAVEVECEEVKNGNYRYPGVGLSKEDEEFLAKKRKERGA